MHSVARCSLRDQCRSVSFPDLQLVFFIPLLLLHDFRSDRIIRVLLNPAHESYEVERTPSGNAHAGAFSNEANELLAAIAGFASPPHAPQSAPPQPK